MSRAYRIRVSETVSHHVHVEDGVCAKLTLLGILHPDRMGTLLGDELAQRGFTIEDGVATREQGEITVEVELATATITVSARAEQEIDVTATATVRAARADAEISKEQAHGAVAGDLQRQRAQLDRAAQKQLTATLDQALAALTDELAEAIDAVTRTALKERAAQLGEIKEITENAETGEMTIRVKL
jgi:hypothetical protein